MAVSLEVSRVNTNTFAKSVLENLCYCFSSEKKGHFPVIPNFYLLVVSLGHISVHRGDWLLLDEMKPEDEPQKHAECIPDANKHSLD